jgi:hypothetical protein
MEEARELLLKHLYLQGGDGLGISDGRVYNACLDAIMEALTIPVVVLQSEQLMQSCSVCGMHKHPVLGAHCKASNCPNEH